MSDDIERLTESLLNLTRAVHMLKDELSSRLEQVEKFMSTPVLIQSQGIPQPKLSRMQPEERWPEDMTASEFWDRYKRG